MFEIGYAAALRDVNSRRFLIANAGAICRATGGKHLIMSSGARTDMVRLFHGATKAQGFAFLIKRYSSTVGRMMLRCRPTAES